MESTNPWTAEKTGSMWDLRIRDTSGESWSIHAIRMLCWSRRWGTVPGRTKSEEFSGRQTAGGAGRKCCTKTTGQGRWIFVLGREAREWCMRRCGTACESQDKKGLRMVQGA